MDPSYQYTTLRTPRSIRVIKLRPKNDNQLSCDLVEVSLDDSPQYYALSYTWDNQTASCPIPCGNSIILITPNCVAALRQLRHESKVRTFWVDSICINQSSNEEKSQQVALMGDIYRNAENVLVWLGDSHGPTEAAMDRMVDLATEPGLSEEKVTKFLAQVSATSENPLGAVFKRSWFYRMWTVQEVILAKMDKALVVCGSKIIPWIAMLTTSSVLNVPENQNDGQMKPAMRLQHYLNEIVAAKRSPIIREVLEGLPSNLLTSTQVYAIFAFAREKMCGDPKDKIFALYGLLQELGVDFPAPDYGKSVEDVYREATISSIEHDKSLDILFQAASDHRRPGLQSWVPDWSDTGWLDVDSRGYMRRFCPSGSAPPTWKFSPNHQHLLVYGKVVDRLVYRTAALDVKESFFKLPNDWQGNYGINEATIMRVSDALSDMHSYFKTLKSWVELCRRIKTYPGGETPKTALRRAVMMDTTLDDELQTAAFMKSFDAWYQVLSATDLQRRAIAYKSANYTLATQIVHEASLSSAPSDEMCSFKALFRSDAAHFHSMALVFANKKCLFTTINGMIGVGPDLIEPGDRIALIAGLGMPVVLRPDLAGYRLVSHVFVHGLMYGDSWPEDHTTGLGEIALV